MACVRPEGHTDHTLRWVRDAALAVVPQELSQAIFAFHRRRQPVSDLRHAAQL